MCSIQKFSEFEQKDLDTILEKRRRDAVSGDYTKVMRYSRELEAFHKTF